MIKLNFEFWFSNLNNKSKALLKNKSNKAKASTKRINRIYTKKTLTKRVSRNNSKE